LIISSETSCKLAAFITFGVFLFLMSQIFVDSIKNTYQ
jgi:F0F1-type ATP synthase membrane subunit b/b'